MSSDHGYIDEYSLKVVLSLTEMFHLPNYSDYSLSHDITLGEKMCSRNVVDNTIKWTFLSFIQVPTRTV